MDSLLEDASVVMLDYSGEGGFDELLREIAWETGTNVIYGREYAQPRMTAWYGDTSYRYSGTTYPARFWTPTLLKVKQSIEALFETEFNGCVCNLYRDGRDSIGWHADDERELGEEPIIASANFGGTRTMSFRRKASHSARQDFKIRDRSLLLMFGKTQRNWQHAVLKEKDRNEPRINLTFRQMKTI